MGGLAFFNASNGAEGDTAALYSFFFVNGADVSVEDPWCFSFWYNMFGHDIGALKVYLIIDTRKYPPGPQDLIEPPFSVIGQQTGPNAWVQANLNITEEDFAVAIQVTSGTGERGNVAIDGLGFQCQMCPAPNLNFSCNFEQGPCGWTQRTDDNSNWALQCGDTPTEETGPLYDHTLGDSNGKYYYMHARPLDMGDRVVLLSPVVAANESQSVWCFSFWYNMYGRGITEGGALKVSVGLYPVNESAYPANESLVLSIAGQQTGPKVWIQAKVAVNQTSDFQVAIEARRGVSSTSDIAIDDVDLSEGECPDLDTGFDCSFEEGYCGWEQVVSNQDANWKLERGTTPLAGPGIEYDHTFGNIKGVYCLHERGVSSIATMISPIVPASSQWYLSFWNHMYGATVGTLRAYQIVEGSGKKILLIKSKHHTGRRVWEQHVTQIFSTTGVRVQLEATVSSSDGDIAIDDILLTLTSPPDPDPAFDCDFEEGLCGWNHPTDGDFNWYRERGDTVTEGTGPEFDQTIGTLNGTYLLFEGRFALPNATAIILSPQVSVPSGFNWIMSLWYNMYGRGIGALNVHQVPEGRGVTADTRIFQLLGEQTNDTTWLQAVITIRNVTAPFNIALEGVPGVSDKSDIAVDDIRVVPDTESPRVTCPDDVPSVSTNPGVEFAVVPWTPMPSATDNIDVLDSNSITCFDDGGNVVMSSSSYGVGTTTVTCNATDSALNIGKCQFNITVVASTVTVSPSTTGVTSISDTPTGGLGSSATSADLSATGSTIQGTPMSGSATTADQSATGATTISDTPMGGSSATSADLSNTGATRISDTSTGGSATNGGQSSTRPTTSRDTLTEGPGTTGGQPVARPTTVGDTLTSGSATNGVPATTVSIEDCITTQAFLVQLRILGIDGAPVVYTNQLANKDSQEFQDIARRIGQPVSRALRRGQRTSTICKFEVVAIRNGSLLVNGVARYPMTAVVDSNTVLDVLHVDAQIDNSLLIDQSVSVVTAETESCPANYCQNAGTCVPVGSFPDLQFSCECAEGFTGSKCEGEDQPANGGVITLAVVAGVLAVAVIFALICACAMVMMGTAKRHAGDRRERVPVDLMPTGYRRPQFNRPGYDGRFSPYFIPGPALMRRMNQDSLESDSYLDDGLRDLDRRIDNFSTPYIVPGPALMRRMNEERYDDAFYY
ncbi:MAM and LDL-receptor class A domain-containing protein 1-like isoform X1 [Patiria miniata]|uniref:Uncharacterized protein n=1 Tax=Patiria miniata TaxID=46514 RepID=A0A913ZP51_PATMI|nr:MAM and LDL-receptor class A domain-containing protein 1-like isoform X1 [Patiria miniata]XP_038052896.1 MAM and LDL-receptor class A domain-containing protein 1-like isoform X1 [Patiria miniata]